MKNPSLSRKTDKPIVEMVTLVILFPVNMLINLCMRNHYKYERDKGTYKKLRAPKNRCSIRVVVTHFMPRK